MKKRNGDKKSDTGRLQRRKLDNREEETKSDTVRQACGVKCEGMIY